LDVFNGESLELPPSAGSTGSSGLVLETPLVPDLDQQELDALVDTANVVPGTADAVGASQQAEGVNGQVLESTSVVTASAQQSIASGLAAQRMDQE
jgi:hypothetical protein